MKLVEANAKFLPTNTSIQEMYKSIEYAARICTHTCENISEDYTKTELFVNNLIKMRHYRALEFGTVYLSLKNNQTSNLPIINFYISNHWSKVKQVGDNVYITTNFRVLVENDRTTDLQYFKYTEFHEPRFTILWDPISRAIADEFRTHVGLSSLMESTRYCNYANGKIGDGLFIVQPTWFTDPNSGHSAKKDYIKSLECAEVSYQRLVFDLKRPEFARGLLPLDIKTTMIQCGFKEVWHNFFDLRMTVSKHNNPHPDAIAISKIAYEDLIKNTKYSF